MNVYGGVKLLDVTEDAPVIIDPEDATHIRYTLPADITYIQEMLAMGYIYGDRTLAVDINLTKIAVDVKKLCRFPLSRCDGRKEELLEIAARSFPYDRRFNVSYTPNETLKRDILSEWIGSLENVFICEYKNAVIGFIALTGIGTGEPFVYLAATDEKYRALGSATSLYGGAILWCVENGFKHLQGRISSLNTAVMNLYAYYGAVFSKPLDVYLKEV